MGLSAAIHAEYELLKVVRSIADLQLETSTTDIYQLASMIKKRICVLSEKQLSLSFQSFGFKYGAPRDSDFIFDVRCLPNPHWEMSLRHLTGLDQPVADYLTDHPLVEALFSDIESFLNKWLPELQANDRSYVTVAIGCTGGQHRSVYLAEQLATEYRMKYPNVQVRHRELARAANLPTP